MADFFSRFRRNRSGAATPALDRWLARDEDDEAIWSTLIPGPSVGAVAARLSSAPGDFLDDAVDLVALGGDVLGALPIDDAAVLAAAGISPETRQAAAVALWLWASEDLVEPFEPPLERRFAGRATAALAFRLAPVVSPVDWFVDAERREEAVRLFLLWSGLQPAGEDTQTTRSLWDRHDSLVRNAALREMVAEQQHRLAVQRALRTKRAAEAAARYSPE